MGLASGYYLAGSAAYEVLLRAGVWSMNQPGAALYAEIRGRRIERAADKLMGELSKAYGRSRNATYSLRRAGWLDSPKPK